MYDSNVKNDSDELKEFKNEITTYLKDNEECFIRLSSTSGKNEEPVRPFNDVDEIIEHITSIKLIKNIKD